MSAIGIADALGLIVEAFGAQKAFTAGQARAYAKALATVPLALLEPMARHAIATRRWLPKAAELLQDAEACRRERLRGLVFDPCEACSHGWVEYEIDGVRRMKRCVCWVAHQARLQAVGGAVPLALPPAQERVDATGGDGDERGTSL